MTDAVTAGEAPNSAGSQPRRWLFVLAILTGSFLLFLVQPMVARMALPKLGGAPNVWNSAMLVYQALLLGGYAYAHFIGRLSLAKQGYVHLAVLALAALTLPLHLAEIAPAAPGWEALWVPWLFLLSVGPVFFAVSAQAPLVQRWFAAHPQAGNPYPLYAASNLGSFGGLIAYPLLAEPLLPLAQQGRLWAFGYLVLLGLVAALVWARRGVAAAAPAVRATEEAAPQERTGWRRIMLWLALSAVPSGLMLSTTTYLTTDIMAMPLLWVIPLGLYLLSFSIAFAEGRGLARLFVLAAPVVLLAGAAMAIYGSGRPGLSAAIASVVLLFVVATALHARLYESRPEPAQLTRFYLVMSLGGALGGLFTALIAPVTFDWTWEHPILMVAAAALLPLGAYRGFADRFVLPAFFVRWTLLLALIAALFAGLAFLKIGEEMGRPGWAIAIALLGLFAFALFVAIRRWSFVAGTATVLAALGGIMQFQVSASGDRSRSYFGVYSVIRQDDGTRQLMHGTTTHGIQLAGEDGQRSLAPSTYYGPTSGAGMALASVPELFGRDAHIGVLGLGVGTLACFRQPGQRWTLFEIDPAVVRYSRDGTFTYVEKCTPDADVRVGDARLEMAETPADSYDLLVLDAFSSDSIPLHLLTNEAMGHYRRALGERGILVVNITNRFLQLKPVLSALAKEQGMVALVRDDVPDWEAGLYSSTWVVMTADPAVLAHLADKGEWEELPVPDRAAWTDDYASILPHLIWENFL
ncbi:spermidine synthase [Paraurantiacibacter namhicola]|uniref:Spermidine synthase n=1 Tax=Paraurantiacibacter namhicola TaxID=645517 RepID=A0A1C7D5I2_9SPHN|nr:fused MFS/spermidine synthase [Paraurantiacibacter namhicola]ANU06724.1 spermidine synthase [Paraurantiacibacter namhicola]